MHFGRNILRHPILKIVIIAFFPMFSGNVFANGITEEPPKAKVVKTIHMKDNAIYELRQTYDLTHGMNYYNYDFGNSTIGYKEVFKGETYGDGDGCPDPKDTDSVERSGNLKNALIKHNYDTLTINADTIDDIDFSLATKSCKTGKVNFFEILILSTDEGFDVVRHEDGKDTLQFKIHR